MDDIYFFPYSCLNLLKSLIIFEQRRVVFQEEFNDSLL